MTCSTVTSRRTATRLPHDVGAAGGITISGFTVDLGPDPDDPLRIVAEVEVDRPLEEPVIGIDISDVRYQSPVGVSSMSVLPALVEPGSYRIAGTAPHVEVYHRRMEVALSMIDDATHRVVDSATIEVEEFGRKSASSVDPMGEDNLRLPLSWRMAPTGPGGESALLGVVGPERSDGAFAIRIVGGSKTYQPLLLLRDGRDIGGQRRTRLPVWALSDIDLAVTKGESVGIVGRNGTGKSTLLRAVGGLTSLDAGTVSLSGATTGFFEIGAGLHPELSGRENVWQTARLLGVEAEDIGRRIDELVEFTGLGEAFDARVKHYSTGMKARLGFAVATQFPSDILLIDELLAVGDEQFRRRAIDLLQERHRSGDTILFVSHETALIEQVCDRVVRMDDGRIVDDGPAGEVLGRYGTSPWAGGAADGSGGVRILSMDAARRHVRKGEVLDFVGELVVEEPHDHAHIEVALRVPLEDRRVDLSLADRRRRSYVAMKIDPADADLTVPGRFAYRCLLTANHLVGELDAAISLVDEREALVLSEAWLPVTVGASRPGEFPTAELDFTWEISPVGRR